MRSPSGAIHPARALALQQLIAAAGGPDRNVSYGIDEEYDYEGASSRDGGSDNEEDDFDEEQYSAHQQRDIDNADTQKLSLFVDVLDKWADPGQQLAVRKKAFWLPRPHLFVRRCCLCSHRSVGLTDSLFSLLSELTHLPLQHFWRQRSYDYWTHTAENPNSDNPPSHPPRAEQARPGRRSEDSLERPCHRRLLFLLLSRRALSFAARERRRIVFNGQGEVSGEEGQRREEEVSNEAVSRNECVTLFPKVSLESELTRLVPSLLVPSSSDNEHPVPFRYRRSSKTSRRCILHVSFSFFSELCTAPTSQ